MSSRQFWRDFLRYTAGKSNAGSVRQLAGAEAAWVHSALVINNAAYLTAPVASEEELDERLAAAQADAAGQDMPWALFLYHPYVNGVSHAEVAAGRGLQPLMHIDTMTADVRNLAGPRRPLPDLEYRRVDNPEEAAAALGINVRAYDMPAFITDSVLATNAYFSDPSREFGYVAYDGGAAVSTATVIALDGCLYVCLVATEPGRRQKGYAEAVMRHALAEAVDAVGITLSALDASAMGGPLYLQMGYAFTGEVWTMYMAH